MSRYHHRHTVNGQEWSVEYGYDPPLSEYFLQVHDPTPVTTVEEAVRYEQNPRAGCDGNGCLFAISSHMTLRCHPKFPGKTRWSNGELLEQMEFWGVPQAHRSQVALDLPF